MTVADSYYHRIDKLDPTTGEVTQYELPEHSHPNDLAVGPDGNLWFTEGDGKIGRITPEGNRTEYALPRSGSPLSITAGPGGELWFTIEGGRIGSITTAGVITEYSLGLPAYGIATDSEGNLWVTAPSADEVLEIGKPPARPPEGEYQPPQQGATVGYGVPLSAAGVQGASFHANGVPVRTGMARGPYGELWVAGLGSSAEGPGRVREFTPTGSVLHTINTGVCLPTSVATDANDDVWVTEVMCAKVQEFSPEGHLLKSFWSFAPHSTGLSFPAGVASDAKRGHVWVADMSRDTLAEFSEAGEYLGQFGSEGSGAGQFKDPRQLALDTRGDVWVADTANNRIDELSPSGAFIKAIGFGVADGGAREETCTSTCRTGIAGGGDGQFSHPTGIAVDQAGDVFVADEGNSRIQELAGETGAYLYQWGQKGVGEGKLEAPAALSLGQEGNPWVLDEGTGQVSEYRVSQAGARAPQEMAPQEVAKWGQEDVPYEATAITPPDEPQSYPATSYRRATVYYLDKEGRLVNTATPSHSPYGAIATTEYNGFNEAVRTLSVDDRIKALESGSHAAEESKLLDTEYVYNGERGEPELGAPPGTELVEKKGPEHMVKVPEKQALLHVPWVV